MADNTIKPKSGVAVPPVQPTPKKKGVDEKERRRNPRPKDDQPKISAKGAQLAAADPKKPRQSQKDDGTTYKKDGGLEREDKGPAFEGDA